MSYIFWSLLAPREPDGLTQPDTGGFAHIIQIRFFRQPRGTLGLNADMQIIHSATAKPLHLGFIDLTTDDHGEGSSGGNSGQSFAVNEEDIIDLTLDSPLDSGDSHNTDELDDSDPSRILSIEPPNCSLLWFPFQMEMTESGLDPYSIVACLPPSPRSHSLMPKAGKPRVSTRHSGPGKKSKDTTVADGDTLKQKKAAIQDEFSNAAKTKAAYKGYRASHGDTLKQKKAAIQDEFSNAAKTKAAYKGYRERGLKILASVVDLRKAREKEDPDCRADGIDNGDAELDHPADYKSGSGFWPQISGICKGLGDQLSSMCSERAAGESV
ncbi:hypothetical protein C8R46DRAFT_1027881 [Mycena filopes]|nr:hypothetical protein C8R46DRAFT_1027881 [Mycena filopes]